MALGVLQWAAVLASSTSDSTAATWGARAATASCSRLPFAVAGGRRRESIVHLRVDSVSAKNVIAIGKAGRGAGEGERLVVQPVECNFRCGATPVFHRKASGASTKI